MLYTEIIAVCSQIHTKHINTLCGQNVELLNVKLVVRIVTSRLDRGILAQRTLCVAVCRLHPVRYACHQIDLFGKFQAPADLFPLAHCILRSVLSEEKRTYNSSHCREPKRRGANRRSLCDRSVPHAISSDLPLSLSTSSVSRTQLMSLISPFALPLSSATCWGQSTSNEHAARNSRLVKHKSLSYKGGE